MNNFLHKLTAVGIGIGIIITFNLFVNLGIATFYDAPQRQNFCGELKKPAPVNQDACEAEGGKWIFFGEGPGLTRIPEPENIKERTGRCDLFFECSQEFELADSVYDRNVFIILTTAGVAAIGIGYLAAVSGIISASLIYGGIISIIIGTTRYWSNMDEAMRFILIGIALAFLLWLGYGKFKHLTGRDSR